MNDQMLTFEKAEHKYKKRDPTFDLTPQKVNKLKENFGGGK